MHALILSTSLSPISRSSRLAQAAANHLTQRSNAQDTTTEVHTFTLISLRSLDLPLCDGDAAYAHPEVQALTDASKQADLILLAMPVYNYDVNAAAKNVIELVGRAWTDKVVGFMCAAGGQGSYMSVMGLANSLMLDFRCVIVPRFVYATPDAFTNEESLTPEVTQRVHELVLHAAGLAQAVRSTTLSPASA